MGEIFKKKIKNRKGQGLTEYIIIVALIALAAIGVVQVFGKQIREQFHTMVAAMAGKEQKVNDFSSESKNHVKNKTLGNYVQ